MKAAEALSDTVVMKTENLRIWPEGPQVEFGLKHGEIVGVARLDGQGQNEFVRVLAGVQPPSEEGVALVRNGASDSFQAIENLAERRQDARCLCLGRPQARGHFRESEHLRKPCPSARRQDAAGTVDKNMFDWPSLSSVFDSMVEKLSIKLGFRSDKITSLSGGTSRSADRPAPSRSARASLC